MHPNIVAAFGADEAGGTHFSVMEYVNESDLIPHRFWTPRTMPPTRSPDGSEPESQPPSSRSAPAKSGDKAPHSKWAAMRHTRLQSSHRACLPESAAGVNWSGSRKDKPVVNAAERGCRSCS